jgi:nicotinamidase-related amidase
VQPGVSQHRSLVDVGDSILIVIDVQDSFLERLPADVGESLVRKIGWLASVAVILGVPVLVTAEDIPKHGTVTHAIEARLPRGTSVFNKMVFGLAEDREIIDALKRAGRKTAVLVGLETDVCIAQSAIGLLQLGYRVVVVADATCSPGTGHEMGLERVRSAGALVSSVKGLYYEWIRTVDRAVQFWEEHSAEIGLPDGV